MKKVVVGLILCFVFIIIYFLELNFFSWFTIAGVKPNIFIILVLFIGLYAGMKMGALFGTMFGFIIDILGSTLIGGSAIALGVIGFVGGYFEKNLSKDSKITVMLMVIVATASYEIFLYIYRSVALSSNLEIWIFIKILFIEIVFNTLLTIILYPVMQKFRI